MRVVLETAAAGLILLFVGFLFKDAIIESYIVPEVINRLKNERFINEIITKGKYVSTDKERFDSNNTIPSNILLELREGKFLKKEDFELFKDAVKKYDDVTEVDGLFDPNCEYRWLPSGYNQKGYDGAYFYPVVVTRKFVAMEWSTDNKMTVYSGKRNKSKNEIGKEFNSKIFRRCP